MEENKTVEQSYFGTRANSSYLSTDKLRDAFEKKLDRAIYERLGEMGFTKQEKLIASFLLQGMGNNAMVRTLNIQPKTIKFHVSNIYKRFGAKGTHYRDIQYRLHKVRHDVFEEVLRETIEQDYNILKEAVLTILMKNRRGSEEYKICKKAWDEVMKNAEIGVSDSELVAGHE